MGPAKEHLIREVLDLDEDEAAKARLVVKRRRKAAERLRSMFAHIAPGVSLADELIADRRAEVRDEEAAEAGRQEIDSGSAKAGPKFSARASRGVLPHMTEDEEKAGLSWEEFRPQ